VKKHWYEVFTSANETMKIYFERHPLRGQKGARWRLFTMTAPEDSPSPWPSPTRGEGQVRPSLPELHQVPAVPHRHVLPLQPSSMLNELLNVADIHVLPQRNDAADLVMPSKLTGMLASGGAVIAMARPGTALHEAVANNGVIVPPEDTPALVDAIAMLAEDAAHRAAIGAAGRRYAETMLSPLSTLLTLDTRLALLTGDASRAKPVTASLTNPPILPARVEESEVE